jgi:predicted enzyme related to lactoylglutathione lyase
MKNIFCHIEIPTLDLPKCRDFYSRLFKWKIKEWSPDYYMINTGGKEGGAGMMLGKPEEFKPGIGVYVCVDSIDGTLVKVEPAGGKIIVPKTEIPKMGWFAILADSENNSIGIFEGMKKPKPKKAKKPAKKKKRIKR